MTAHHPHRPTIAVTQHAISAGHYLAATAGFDILQAGGNAIDAGCAAGIALGVLQSDLVDVAGVAPIMIYLADKQEVVTIAGLGPWPKALDPELFLREHGGKIPKGVLRTVVPAAPDAWITALAALRHDELWRGRGGGDPVGARRLPDVSADGREPEAARGGSSRLAVDGGDLSAERAAARSWRVLPADRPRGIVAIHGRRGTRRGLAGPRGRARSGARRLLSRRHRRARSSAS